MISQEALKLLECFRGSFINAHGEFIANDKSNTYFTLSSCDTLLEVKCKILEWFSRDAFKTEPFHSKKKNDELHRFLLNGINQFLMTEFSPKDMELIYTELGNQINRELTVRFIQSGYDLKILEDVK